MLKNEIMKDSKINMNKPPLTESEINAAKDFDKILSGAGTGEPEPKPTGTSKLKYIIGGVVVALIGGLIWLWPSAKEKTEVIPSEKVDVSVLNINPLINNVDVPKDSYTIQASVGGTVTTPTGTNIIIPPNAFLNEKGNIITGEATLKFREFHDIPSVFAAGINMTYDSLGQEYHFESAGMFEIEGFQGDEKLYANAGAPIVVELASSQPGDYYNIYFQDPKNGWEFIRKDTAFLKAAPVMDTWDYLAETEKIQLLKSELKKKDKSFKKALKKEDLILPEKANDDLYSMKIAFKNSEFPELAGYKNILFEITEANEDFDPAMAKKEWSDIALKKNLLGVYVMHLYGSSKEKLFVRPVFAAEDMTEANATFELLFDAYNATTDGKLGRERDALKALAKSCDSIENMVVAANNSSQAFNANLGVVHDNQEKVKRIFTLANFGLWNSDCPSMLPKGQDVYPVFVNEDNVEDTLTFNTLFIAEYDRNALFTFWGGWGNKDIKDEEGKAKRVFENPMFTFNPKKETVVWFVTKEGKLAIITPEKLKKTIFSKGNTTVKMKVEEEMADVNTVRKLLGWK